MAKQEGFRSSDEATPPAAPHVNEDLISNGADLGQEMLAFQTLAANLIGPNNDQPEEKKLYQGWTF